METPAKQALITFISPYKLSNLFIYRYDTSWFYDEFTIGAITPSL